MPVINKPLFEKGSLIIAKDVEGFDSFGIITRIQEGRDTRFLRRFWKYEIKQASYGTVQWTYEPELCRMIANGEVEIRKP